MTKLVNGSTDPQYQLESCCEGKTIKNINFFIKFFF